MLTLGSLFDGSGGFPLAAKLAGIRPVWASEIEPFPGVALPVVFYILNTLNNYVQKENIND